MLYLSPCGKIQDLFILWRQFKNPKLPPSVEVSLLNDTLLLGAFNAENYFSGSLGIQEFCCLPCFVTYCILSHAYFKLEADSKGPTDLVKVLTELCVLFPTVASDRWLGNSLRNESSIVWFFLWDTLSTFGKVTVHLRLLCLIGPDWSVSINLVSPFLNEFIVLIFELTQQLNFQHRDALWAGTSICVIVAFHKTIHIEPPLSIESGGRHVRTTT